MRSSILLSLSVLLAGGCSIGPDYIRPETPMPESFADADAMAATSSPIEETWWRRFEDPQLQDLIVEAVKSNKSLEIALTRVNQSRALRQQAFFQLLPIGTANSAYTNTKIPAIRFGDIAQGDIEFESYSAGVDAAWEIDILGRVRRNLEGRSAELEADKARLEDALRIVVAEVAQSYFELRGFQEALTVAERNVQTQQQVLEVVDARQQAGEGTELDQVRAQALLSTTRASVAPLLGSVKQTMNRLAVLLGKQPHEVRSKLEERKSLPKFKGELNVGSPADLLRRRPDIRTAERVLAASVADIGVATGDLFPKVSLLGSLSIEAPSPDEWGKTGTRGYSMGPRIEWAAFDLGRVLARMDAADARSQGALKAYEQTVLVALEETSSALASLRASQDRVRELQNAVQNNRRAVELSLAGYREGAIDFLTVLQSQQDLLTSEGSEVRAETTYGTSIIALYKALGGGWEEFAVIREDAVREDAVPTDANEVANQNPQ